MEKINLETVDEIARNDIAAIVGGNSAGWQKKLISLAGESARIIWLAATQGKSTCPPEHIFKLIRLYERAKPEKKRSDVETVSLFDLHGRADKVVLTFCIKIIVAMETASGFDRVKAAVEIEPCELARWWAETSKNIRRRFVFSSLRDADREIQRAIAAVSAGQASLRSTAENPQAEFDTTEQAPPKQGSEVANVNSKSKPEEIAAYQLTRLTGYTQQKAAELMSAERKFKEKYPRGIKQHQISRWVSQYVKRLKAHGLPVEPQARVMRVHADLDAINLGQRTDGRKPKKPGL